MHIAPALVVALDGEEDATASSVEAVVTRFDGEEDLTASPVEAELFHINGEHGATASSRWSTAKATVHVPAASTTSTARRTTSSLAIMGVGREEWYSEEDLGLAFIKKVKLTCVSCFEPRSHPDPGRYSALYY
jgi:hypothetical protein